MEIKILKTAGFTMTALCLVLVGLFLAYGCEKPDILPTGGDDGNSSISQDTINLPNNDSIFKDTMYSNIEDLYEQPLSVIQECVKGKWKFIKGHKWGYMGLIYPTNTLINIDTENDKVVITANEVSPGNMIMTGALNGTSSCSWEAKEVYSPGFSQRPPCYTTFVMQFNGDNNEESKEILNMKNIERVGWFFNSIRNDSLQVFVHFSPDSANFSYYEWYEFLRIREK